MTYYKPPMLLDAFRMTGASVDETVDALVNYYETPAALFNFLRALRFMRNAYDGASDIAGMVAACRGDGRTAFTENAKVLEATLPKIVGRSTKAFSHPPRRYNVTPEVQCALGPSCFVTEDGRVKLIYLHSRNHNRATLGDLAAFAELVRQEILESEFFGEAGDVELHLVNKTGANRDDVIHNLASLAKHADRDPHEAMRIFAAAFVKVDSERLAGDLKPAARREKQVEDASPRLFPDPVL